jgi:protein-tyrosine phosphatase
MFTVRESSMIDWHSHILPGIDDGAADLEQSIAMAQLLSVGGFTEVYCTPHLMRGCYEAAHDEVRRGVAELQEMVNSRGIPLKLHPGREYCLDEYLADYLKDPLPLGNSSLILVEIPPRITADMVRQLLYGVVRSGFTPVIAHPERCHLLEPATARRKTGRGLLGGLKSLIARGGGASRDQDRSDFTGNPLLDYLRDLGCSFQGNLGSFCGFYGRQVQSAAEKLRSRGIYDRYGSDLHAPEQAARVLQTPLMH